jgi:hypothetical protein
VLRSIATLCALLALGAVAHAGGPPRQPTIAHDGKAIALWQSEHRKRRLDMKHATKHGAAVSAFRLRTK